MEKKPRPHAELIKQWADGCEIQHRNNPHMQWTDVPDPAFVADYEYRVKPTREYPETKLSHNDLYEAYRQGRSDDDIIWNSAGCKAVANAALRHAIDAGQVVTREEFDRAIGDRNKRDMAVAQAVMRACAYVIPHGMGASYIAREMTTAKLNYVIAEVRP